MTWTEFWKWVLGKSKPKPTPPPPQPPKPKPPEPTDPPKPTPPKPPTPTPPGPIPNTPMDVEAAKARLLILHNERRADDNAGPMRRVPKLDMAAQGHSDWCALNRKSGHYGENNDLFTDRIRRQGYAYSSASENVASGFRSPIDVMDRGWMYSTGHKENLLNPAWTECGFGIAEGWSDRLGRVVWFWTAVFARPARRIQVAPGVFDVEPPDMTTLVLTGPLDDEEPDSYEASFILEPPFSY
jgi:uncharacterized protein YkwD